MTATSTAASSLPPVRTSCHVPLSLMTSISEETIALWLKLGALEKLEQAVLDGYGDQLCGKTSRIPQVNKFLKQVPLFQTKIREIHQAVSQGRLRDVQHLIDRKKLAFCRDHNGASPLHKAVIFGHKDVIEYLVKRYGGVIHIRDYQGRTALHYAAFLPDGGEIYQYLLALGADERAMDVYGRQPSYYLDGQNESTLRQLRDGSTLNGIRKIKPRYYGQVSAGQPFAASNKLTVTKSQIRELISEGNLSALEDLVLQGQGDRLLGETSAVPKIQSFLSIVPMYMERIYDVHRAVMRDQLEHVVILLENRKLAMARDQLGATPLHKAVWFGHYKIAHYISHQFPETLNAIDMEGRTALHYAAALKDNRNMYGILIEAGANKGIFDNKGKTADYYSQYPEHLNLEEVIKRCHKVNANYLANTASRIKGKSPVRQSPPPSNGNSSSPRSDDNPSSKETSQSNDSGNENEMVSILQKEKLAKRLDMSSANIRRWVNAKDMDKLTKAVMEGYGDKVVRVNTTDDSEEKDQISGKITEIVERINAIHTAVSSDDLSELQNHLEEKDYALAKDHMGMTPLHKAVLLKKTKIVAFLIERFPETINAKNKNGLTALHYAAAMSRKDGLQLYKMLLQAGADPKIRDNHGRTPDYYKTHLITMPKTGMMRSRQAGGRHPETLNRYSKQGVMERMTTALQRGDVELLHDLVLEGHGKHLIGKTSWNEDVKSFLKELPTLLNSIQTFHEAIRNGDVDKVKELMANNEKFMRARDETGALPLHLAAASESHHVLQYFADHYPSILNVKDAMGRTALHIVSQKGNHSLYKILKQAGADPKILDQKGRTADFYLQSAKSEHSPRKSISDSSKTPLKSNLDGMHSSSVSDRASKNSQNAINKRKSLTTEEKTGNKAREENSELKSQEDSSQNVNQKLESTESDKSNEAIEDNEAVKGSQENEVKSAEVTDKTEEPLNESAEPMTNDGSAQNEHESDDKNENNVDEDEELKTHLAVSETNEGLEDHSEDKNPTDNDADTKVADNDETTNAVNAIDINDNNPSDEVTEHKNDEGNSDIDEGNEDASNTTDEDDDEDSRKTEIEVVRPNLENVKNSNEEELSENEENTKEESTEGETDKGPPKESEALDNVSDREDEEANEKSGAEDEKEDVNHNDDATEADNNTSSDMKTSCTEEKKDENGNHTEETANEENSPDTNKNVDTADKNETNSEEKSGENISSIQNFEGKTVAEVGSGKLANADDTQSHEEEHPSGKNDGLENTEDASEEKEDKSKIEEQEKSKEGIDETESKNLTTEDEEISDEKEKSDKHQVENDATDSQNENEKLNENEIEEDKENVRDIKSDANANAPEESEEPKIAENTSNPEDETTKKEEDSELKNEEPEGTENSTNTDENQNVNTADDSAHQTKDHLDELIEHWIREGDLLRLEHVVLAGQGDRLIERTSDDKQVQDFLDLVPIYMAKIKAVHESVAKGHLREVRSVLTRKRFALSRDHVGASPLHLAVLHGHTDVSTYIISHFPETMDGPDNEGRTPLHYATALPDNGALYKLLKSAGADENIEDKAGHSPKYYMTHPGTLTLAQLMEPYVTHE